MSQVTSIPQTRPVIDMTVYCPIKSAEVSVVKISRTCLVESRDDLRKDHFQYAVITEIRKKNMALRVWFKESFIPEMYMTNF